MKTTMDLPDELFEQLKRQAGRDQVPMREVLISGLIRELQLRANPAPKAAYSFPVSDGIGIRIDGLTAQQAIDLSYGLPL